MLLTLTKKEYEALEDNRKEAFDKFKEANRKARALRPDEPDPPYGDNDDETIRLYEDWVNRGSDEWRKAYHEALALQNIRYVKSKTFKDADEKLLKKITKSQEATVKDLKRQARIYLQTGHAYKEDGKGCFVPDYESVRSGLFELFFVPMQTLDTDHQVEVDNYIDLEFRKLPPKLRSYTPAYNYYASFYIRQEGTDSGKRDANGDIIPVDYAIDCFVSAQYMQPDETTEGRYTVTTPKDYVTTVDRISKEAFKGGLIRPLDADSSALWDVPLSTPKSRHEVIARVAIDYREMTESGVFENVPTLTADDYDVLDAIHSELSAGNYAFTKTMLYRVMTGKMKEYLPVPEEVEKIIDAALLKFKGTLTVRYSEIDKDGNERAIELDEPIVTYMKGKGYLNNKYVDDLIMIPNDERFTPPFLKWARFNNNEIDSRDVTLLDVKGLNNSKESRAIKMCLYRRIITMRNLFERKYHSRKELPDNKRSIRYDYIYSTLGLDEDTLTKDKRHDVKTKVDKCMKAWTPKLISGYRHKKDGNNAYYAVEVSFMPEKTED